MDVNSGNKRLSLGVAGNSIPGIKGPSPNKFHTSQEDQYETGGMARLGFGTNAAPPADAPPLPQKEKDKTTFKETAEEFYDSGSAVRAGFNISSAYDAAPPADAPLPPSVQEKNDFFTSDEDVYEGTASVRPNFFTNDTSAPTAAWYVEPLSNADCEDFLAAQRPGAFVVCRPNDYCLCVHTNRGTVERFTLVHNKTTLQYSINVPLTTPESHSSINALVEYYQDHWPGMPFTLLANNPVFSPRVLQAIRAAKEQELQELQQALANERQEVERQEVEKMLKEKSEFRTSDEDYYDSGTAVRSGFIMNAKNADEDADEFFTTDEDVYEGGVAPSKAGFRTNDKFGAPSPMLANKSDFSSPVVSSFLNIVPIDYLDINHGAPSAPASTLASHGTAPRYGSSPSSIATLNGSNQYGTPSSPGGGARLSVLGLEQPYASPVEVPGTPAGPSWLHGEISRDAAQGLLAGSLPGVFLVRTKGTNYVLSIINPTQPEGFEHHTLQKGSDGLFMINSVPLKKACMSVLAIVRYLTTELDNIGVLLVKPS